MGKNNWFRFFGLGMLLVLITSILLFSFPTRSFVSDSHVQLISNINRTSFAQNAPERFPSQLMISSVPWIWTEYDYLDLDRDFNVDTFFIKVRLTPETSGQSLNFNRTIDAYWQDPISGSWIWVDSISDVLVRTVVNPGMEIIWPGAWSANDNGSFKFTVTIIDVSSNQLLYQEEIYPTYMDAYQGPLYESVIAWSTTNLKDYDFDGYDDTFWYHFTVAVLAPLDVANFEINFDVFLWDGVTGSYMRVYHDFKTYSVDVVKEGGTWNWKLAWPAITNGTFAFNVTISETTVGSAWSQYDAGIYISDRYDGNPYYLLEFNYFYSDETWNNQPTSDIDTLWVGLWLYFFNYTGSITFNVLIDPSFWNTTNQTWVPDAQFSKLFSLTLDVPNLGFSYYMQVPWGAPRDGNYTFVISVWDDLLPNTTDTWMIGDSWFEEFLGHDSGAFMTTNEWFNLEDNDYDGLPDSVSLGVDLVFYARQPHGLLDVTSRLYYWENATGSWILVDERFDVYNNSEWLSPPSETNVFYDWYWAGLFKAPQDGVYRAEYELTDLFTNTSIYITYDNLTLHAWNVNTPIGANVYWHEGDWDYDGFLDTISLDFDIYFNMDSNFTEHQAQLEYLVEIIELQTNTTVWSFHQNESIMFSRTGMGWFGKHITWHSPTAESYLVVVSLIDRNGSLNLYQEFEWSSEDPQYQEPLDIFITWSELDTDYDSVSDMLVVTFTFKLLISIPEPQYFDLNMEVLQKSNTDPSGINWVDSLCKCNITINGNPGDQRVFNMTWSPPRTGEYLFKVWVHDYYIAEPRQGMDFTWRVIDLPGEPPQTTTPPTTSEPPISSNETTSPPIGGNETTNAPPPPPTSLITPGFSLGTMFLVFVIGTLVSWLLKKRKFQKY